MFLSLSSLGQHPNIIQCHDIGFYGGAVYLQLEYIEGDDLEIFTFHKYKRVRQLLKPLSTRGILYVALTLFHVIHWLEKKGFMHRDIKPANVMVSRIDGKLKLVDFNIGTLLDDAGQATGTYGTNYYRSPEVANSWGDDPIPYGPSADTFSLGRTLCDLLQLPDKVVLPPHDPFAVDTEMEDPLVLANNRIRTYVREEEDMEKKGPVSPECLDLIVSMMTFNPKERLTYDGLLNHPLVQKFTCDGRTKIPTDPEEIKEALEQGTYPVPKEFRNRLLRNLKTVQAYREAEEALRMEEERVLAERAKTAVDEEGGTGTGVVDEEQEEMERLFAAVEADAFGKKKPSVVFVDAIDDSISSSAATTVPSCPSVGGKKDRRVTIAHPAAAY